MNPTQPSLLKSPAHKPHSSGPVFEFGPGWGTRLNKWFKKNAGKKILPPISIVVLALGLFLFFQGEKQVEKTKLQAANIISQIVLAGESKTHVARRAVKEYLEKNDDLTLTHGQRIFVESKLVQLINSSDFRTGQVIEFDPEQIHTFGQEAESLSPATLQKWEGYAKKVRF